MASRMTELGSLFICLPLFYLFLERKHLVPEPRGPSILVQVVWDSNRRAETNSVSAARPAPSAHPNRNRHNGCTIISYGPRPHQVRIFPREALASYVFLLRGKIITTSPCFRATSRPVSFSGSDLSCRSSGGSSITPPSQYIILISGMNHCSAPRGS